MTLMSVHLSTLEEQVALGAKFGTSKSMCTQAWTMGL